MELTIQRKVEGIQSILQLDSRADPGVATRLNPAIRRHFELKINTLQNAPREVDKLERILRAKKRENDQATTHTEDTQRLVTEIEMLQIVLCLVRRKQEQQQQQSLYVDGRRTGRGNGSMKKKIFQ